MIDHELYFHIPIAYQRFIFISYNFSLFKNIYLFILQVANLLLTVNQYNLIVAALCTNLTLNEKNSQLLIANRGLRPFVQLAIDTTDLMYFKILHNMSSHESLKPQFVVCIIVLIITIMYTIFQKSDYEFI